MNQNKYDIIYIVESGFQQKIIDHLIDQVYPNKSYLVIKKNGDGFLLGENNWQAINFNHSKGILKSISTIYKFPKLKCERLIGTHFTGVNCRFFEAIINYDKLELIDDGIGTPVILDNPNFYFGQPFSILKFFVLRLLMLSVFLKTKNTKNIIKNVTLYHSVYFKDYLGLKVNYLDYFKKWSSEINRSKIGFIGQPFVEYGFISEIVMIKLINQIISENNVILNYFPDPCEKWIYNQKIENLNVVTKDKPLELYFKENGTPETLYTFVSSALLNIKMISPSVTGYYMKVPNQDKYRKPYYLLFEKVGAKEYKYDFNK
jgi:hypothetical protein